MRMNTIFLCFLCNITLTVHSLIYIIFSKESIFSSRGKLSESKSYRMLVYNLIFRSGVSIPDPLRFTKSLSKTLTVYFRETSIAILAHLLFINSRLYGIEDF